MAQSLKGMEGGVGARGRVKVVKGGERWEWGEVHAHARTGRLIRSWRGSPLQGHLGQLGSAVHEHLQFHIDHLTEHLQETRRDGPVTAQHTAQ